jgi:hypothetical protein
MAPMSYLRPRRRTLSAWDRAVREFALAWKLSPGERTALQMTLSMPLRRPETLVRELLADAGGLALEASEPDVAAWCYATCERVGTDATWDEIGPERALAERLGVAVADAGEADSLVWSCVRLVPPDAEHLARVMHLTMRVVHAFVSDAPRDRQRAGVAAALGVVIARRLRDEAPPNRGYAGRTL